LSDWLIGRSADCFLFFFLIGRLADSFIGRLSWLLFNFVFNLDWLIGRSADWKIDSLSTIKSFEDLPVWQDARKFTNKFYNLTNKFPKEELYGLTSQIRRATVSIMSNNAEGFDRRSDK